MPNINKLSDIVVGSISKVDGIVKASIGLFGGLELGELPVHVFLLAGQSNMVGRPTFDGGAGYPAGTLQYPKSTGFSTYSDTTTIDAASPLGHWDADAGDMGLDLQFVIDYVAANDVQVVLIPAADGGTGFTSNEWNPGDAQYEHAVDATNALMTANPTWSLEGILWHQGERDHLNADFEEQFFMMLQSMREDITVATQETPFILGELLPGGTNTVALNTDVLADTTTYNYGTALVSASGLTSLGDNLHFSAASLRTFGTRYQTAFSGLSNPYHTAETGALHHSIHGTSNQLLLDLAGNDLMTKQGTGHDFNSNQVILSGVTAGPTNNGIDTGVAETSDFTMCAVFEYQATGDLNMICGNLGLHAFPGGHSWFRNGAGDLRLNERSGTGTVTLRTAAQMTVGNHYFIGSSLDEDDNYVAMIADVTNTSFSATGTGAGRTVGTGRNIGIGNVHYQDTNFDGQTKVSELILFNTTKTLSELEAIAGRSRTRMSARGITVQ